MTFLTPIAGIVAAAIAVPLLLTLYMLRLRRMPLRVPSTLLWQNAVQDLEANVPFQRLRWSPLLLLQLIVVLLVVLAFAQPRIGATTRAAQRVVIVVDRSASMSTLVDAETGTTRLDEARVEAIDLVQRLSGRQDGSEMMVIAMGAEPVVVQPFEARRQVVADAIESIEPSDEAAAIDRAVELAETFAGAGDEGERRGRVIFVTDGCFDPAGASAGATEMLLVGEAADNTGIVEMSARRRVEDPAEVDVLVRVVSTLDEAHEVVVTILLDDAPLAVRRGTVTAAGAEPGEATVLAQIEAPGGGVLRARLDADDALAADDVAAVVLPAPRPPRFLVVHPETGVERFLIALLEALEPAAVDTVPIDAWTGASGEHDLVIFDRVAPETLPAAPTLAIGAAVPGVERLPPRDESAQRIVSWDRRHGLMRYVALDPLVFDGVGGLELPPGATALAWGREGPVIGTFDVDGIQHVAIAFEVRRSNWALSPGAIVFLENVLIGAAGEGSGAVAIARRPGEAITVRAAEATLRVRGPSDHDVAAEPGRQTVLPALRRRGSYAVDGAAAPDDVIALSVLDPHESDVRPRAPLAADDDGAAQDTASLVPGDLWPWLVLAAVVVLTAEWLFYLQRVRA